jgi:hypothetical protein
MSQPGRVGPVLVLVVIGSGSCHDRIKRRSNQSQDQSREQRQNLAFQFQQCGSMESLLSTIVIHPTTSLGTAGASS